MMKASNIISGYYNHNCFRFISWPTGYVGTHFSEREKNLIYQRFSKQAMDFENDEKKYGNLFRKYIKQCRFCHGVMNKIEKTVCDIGYGDTTLTSYVCEDCNYWQAFIHYHDSYYQEERYGFGVLKKYSINDINIPVNELRNYLQKKYSAVRSIHTKRFEILVGEIMKDHFGNAEVKHVGKTNDGGVDLILVQSEKETWLIQCKRREKDNSVQKVDTVRTLVGTLIEKNNLKGMIVSTADHFSKGSYKYIISPNVIKFGIEIKLIDYGLLKQIIENNKIIDPWDNFANNDISIPIT